MMFLILAAAALALATDGSAKTPQVTEDSGNWFNKIFKIAPLPVDTNCAPNEIPTVELTDEA